MSSWMRNWKTYLLLTAALAGVGVAYVLSNSESRVQCSTSPCTFIEGGREFVGTCGSKKDDTKSCYCFKPGTEGATTDSAEADSRPAQKQAGCSTGR